MNTQPQADLSVRLVMTHWVRFNQFLSYDY